MTTSDVLRKIEKTLLSKDFQARFNELESLPELRGLKSLGMIEIILKLEGNLATKLEALRVLPGVLTSSTSGEGCRLLELVLEDEDAEIVRGALLAIQTIPEPFINRNLVDAVIRLLKHEDTDLKYQAVVTLSFLRSHLSRDEFYSHLFPLTKHANATLRGLSKKLILS